LQILKIAVTNFETASAKPTSAMAVENAAIRRSYSKPPYMANPATRKFLGDQEMKADNSEDRKRNKYTYFVSPPYTVRIADRCQSESLIAVILAYLMSNVISRLAWNNGPVEVRDQRMF
jgi:hypothetical protein